MTKINKILPLILLCTISCMLFFVYQKCQPVLSYEYSKRADGHQYEKIYSYFKGHATEYKVSFPFHSRIFVPWLASLLPFQHHITNFQIINLLFLLLSVASLYLLWAKLKISLPLIGLGFSWLLLHWTGIIRLNQFDPLTVDVPLYFFQTLFLLIIIHKKYAFLPFLAIIATSQKESFIALLFILLFFLLFFRITKGEKSINIKWVILALACSLITKNIINSYFPPIEEGRNSVTTILFHLKETIYDPFRIIRWLAALFTAFGALFLLAVRRTAKNITFSRFEQLLLLCTAVYLLLGMLAGNDMTRIIFLGFPFIMTYILICLKGIPIKYLAIIYLLSIPLMRIWSVIPDVGKARKQFFMWYPEYAETPVVLAWFIYGVVVFGIVLFLYKKILVKK